MALQKTVKTPHGFNAENAYMRVENVAFLSKTTIGFNLQMYKTSEEAQSFSSKSFVCSYEMDGVNPIQQAYQHIKTLPEFTGATDC